MDTAASETTLYNYDALGNLRQVTLPGGTMIEYIVDGLGQRIGKKVGGALVKGWLWGDALRPVAELDGTGAVVARFVYAEGVNVPDLMIKGGTAYRMVTDAVGSVRLVVHAATGAVVQRMDYDEFGRVLLDTNPGFQPFGFAGGLYDSNTGLVHFGVRDYDAEVGRWAAKDPLRFEGGDANLYLYARGDPLNYVDREGEEAIEAAAAAAPVLVAVDGPLPIGDVVAVGLLICAAIYDEVTVGRRPPPNLNRCLDACAQGTFGRSEFCRSIRDPAKRARCWAKVMESETSCRNWCYYEFGR
jgi:RHS repeat-associated protein